MSMSHIVVDCRRISKSYRTRNGVVHALQDVDLALRKSEIVCLVGPSGCGKTTLLKLIAGLLEPDSGQITNNSSGDGARPRGALVFQEHGLFPWMTVLDNVAFGLELAGVGRKERREKAMGFVDKVGLRAFVHRYPHELSVGMRQRVGIARAFVAGSPLLLMDEPFGSLDAQTRLVLQQELLRIWGASQVSILYVTHDIEEAVLLADRVVVMTGRPGRVREEIPVTIKRPRALTVKDQNEITEIRWRIWEMLEDEVRKSLWLPQ